VNLTKKGVNLKFPLIFHIGFWLHIYSQQKEADACIQSKNEKLAMYPYENGYMSFMAKLETHFDFIEVQL
jgi:hypothetical protein